MKRFDFGRISEICDKRVGVFVRGRGGDTSYVHVLFVHISLDRNECTNNKLYEYVLHISTHNDHAAVALQKTQKNQGYTVIIVALTCPSCTITNFT